MPPAATRWCSPTPRAASADLAVGQPVLVADHLNLTGGSPVSGPLAGQVPARFVDLTEAYSRSC